MPDCTATSVGSTPQQATVGNAFRDLMSNTSVQLLALVFLFTTTAVYEAFDLSALAGMDVWSHLRTGIWILQNHAVPRNGLFSQYPDFPGWPIAGALTCCLLQLTT